MTYFHMFRLMLYILPVRVRVYQPHATKVKYVPVLYAHEQMWARGCSGHSRKKADEADVVQDISYPLGTCLEPPSMSISPRGPALGQPKLEVPGN